ncbi:hypothetical protein AGJ31_00840 [Cronobacter turicensis]|nr:hypothetical protein [Cronobacter turicensis]
MACEGDSSITSATLRSDLLRCSSCDWIFSSMFIANMRPAERVISHDWETTISFIKNILLIVQVRAGV